MSRDKGGNFGAERSGPAGAAPKFPTPLTLRAAVRSSGASKTAPPVGGVRPGAGPARP